jgi:hypothetical protein
MNNQNVSKEELKKKIEGLLEQIRKEEIVRDHYTKLGELSAQRVKELLEKLKELNEELKKINGIT